MKLKRLTIRNYRCLKDVSFEVKNLNVLIGPNGSGKSSILDVFDLMASGMELRLSKAVAMRGGIDDVVTIGPPGQKLLEFAFDFSLKRPRETARYEIALVASSRSYALGYETLSSRRPGSPDEILLALDSGGLRASLPRAKLAHGAFNELELLTPQAPRRIALVAPLISFFASAARYREMDASADAPIRRTQALEPVVLLPAPDGGNLASVLYNLRSDHAKSYQRILEAVAASFPGFRTLEFPLVAAGRVVMTWHDDAVARPLYVNQWSEGMLRFLTLATILLSPAAISLLAIDEPEASLHPEALMTLAGILQEAAERRQVFVATQADRLIRWLRPEEVVVVDREDGAATVRRATDRRFRIKEWLKDFTLDELWLNGQLGGRP